MARWMGILGVLALVLAALPAPATVFRNGNTVTVGASETVDDDLVISGGTVRVLGRVTGDVVAAGGDVEVSGPVGGDAILAGGNVKVRGPVRGSLYVATGDLTLSAPVTRNALVAAGSVTADRGAAVGRDLTASAGNITVGSRIGRNLQVSTGNLTLTDNARVGGDLLAQTSSPSIAAGAVIAGRRQISQAERPHAGRGAAGWVLWQLLSGLGLLLAGLLFVAVAPHLTEQAEVALRTRPWASLLAGLVVLLIGGPLFILLLLTIIGIPLAFIWLALYFTAIFLSPIFLAILVGRLVWRHPSGNLFTALLIGIALFILVRLIPILGFLVTLAAMLFGLGAVVLVLQARTHHLPPATASNPPATG